jgi:Uma2 family endonuclease
LAVILNENLQIDERYPSRAPDIAIEIVSRDDIWSVLFDKAALYLEKGSHEVWLIDPYQKGVLVVSPKTRRWESELLTCPKLPGFQVELKNIFNWPAPPSAGK